MIFEVKNPGNSHLIICKMRKYFIVMHNFLPAVQCVHCVFYLMTIMCTAVPLWDTYTHTQRKLIWPHPAVQRLWSLACCCYGLLFSHVCVKWFYWRVTHCSLALHTDALSSFPGMKLVIENKGVMLQMTQGLRACSGFAEDPDSVLSMHVVVHNSL